MAEQNKDPLKMVKDPFAGDLFVLPETSCTEERKAFFHRCNEILKFLHVSNLALVDCREKYASFFSKMDTPLKLAFSDGHSVIMPVCTFLNGCDEGVEFLCRQVFVMLYGSWETFLYQILERSFRALGVPEIDILDKSLSILMKGMWDGKFCKMNSLIGIDYRAGDLSEHFKGFELRYADSVYKNPILYLDEIAKIRHRIIHYSGILENGKAIAIQFQFLPKFYVFYALLTEYVDRLYALRFNYPLALVNPAQA